MTPNIRCDIAGVSFRGVKAQLTISSLPELAELTLVPDPNNKYDPQAIKVFAPNGEWIGFVPARLCANVLPHISTAKAFWSAGKLEISFPIPAREGREVSAD